MKDLFDNQETRVRIADDAVLLRSYATADDTTLLSEIAKISVRAPFRKMATPGGFLMSVAMTSCGKFGWITDRGGYRYSQVDPETNQPWPEMPASFRKLAETAARHAGYNNFAPDTCLINRYEPGAKMSLHQDKDEREFLNPIVSISLGLSATFQFGGLKRTDPVRKYDLSHGDVVVWGGRSRLFYHGILPLKSGAHPKLGSCRLNLTFRKAD